MGERQRAGEMTEVVASQRYNAHMVPEDGSLTCSEAGVCKFVLASPSSGKLEPRVQWFRGGNRGAVTSQGHTAQVSTIHSHSCSFSLHSRASTVHQEPETHRLWGTESTRATGHRQGTIGQVQLSPGGNWGSEK